MSHQSDFSALAPAACYEDPLTTLIRSLCETNFVPMPACEQIVMSTVVAIRANPDLLDQAQRRIARKPSAKPRLVAVAG